MDPVRTRSMLELGQAWVSRIMLVLVGVEMGEICTSIMGM